MSASLLNVTMFIDTVTTVREPPKLSSSAHGRPPAAMPYGPACPQLWIAGRRLPQRRRSASSHSAPDFGSTPVRMLRRRELWRCIPLDDGTPPAARNRLPIPPISADYKNPRPRTMQGRTLHRSRRRRRRRRDESGVRPLPAAPQAGPPVL